MTLQILDRGKNKLYSDGNFWELSRKEENNCFYGVSFVSSIKFIEEKLLPFYQDIELILGLSDNGNNSIGQRMQELMDKRVSWVNYVENNLESEFAKRILDGSLRLRFTKDNLIHSKIYLMENKEQNTYQCFTGSMNLTETAVSKNFEQLIWDYGSKNDDLYQLYKQMYDDIKKNSATYLDSKRLKGFLVKDNSKQTQLNVYTDSVNMLSNSTDADEKVNFPSDEVKVYLNDKTKEIQNGNLGKKEAVTVNQTIKLFTELGNLRKEKTLKKATSEILNLNQIIEYQENSKKSSKKKSDVDYFPKPALIWNNEFEKLFTAPKVGEGGQALKQVSLSDEELKEKLQLFCDIVNEYDTYKLSGEGWQTLGFLLYLYEAPFIWKIRDLYDLADKSKHREDVPIAVALIGQGKTGKSTLGRRLAAKLTGALNFTGSGEFEARNKYVNKAISDVINEYLQTAGPVSPLMIDDVRPDLTTRQYFEDMIKRNSNSITGPMPTAIFTMNKEDDSKGVVSNRHEIARRIWFLSFESSFKGNSKEGDLKVDELLNRADSDLYYLCQQLLEEYFKDISEEDAIKIQADFLYPIKKILKDLLVKYDLFQEIKKFFEKDNYDYTLYRGKSDWHMLIEQVREPDDFSFVESNGKLQAQFNKQAFNKLSDGTNKNNGSSQMGLYYNNLPRKYEISDSSKYGTSGFMIDVDNFDKWMGEPVLRKKYEDTHGITDKKEKEEENYRQAKMQAQIQMDLQKDLVKQVVDAMDERNKKKKGFFGKIFGGK
ncbi:phospholipase D family protein [Ligilactobacillus salivarius]|uniref:phospholipase D family protein n=1 Tax=Ligilactobacillus salivarius TaxID=1624 RepID=UPI003F1F137C